jgi:hypothetical protein
LTSFVSPSKLFALEKSSLLTEVRIGTQVTGVRRASVGRNQNDGLRALCATPSFNTEHTARRGCNAKFQIQNSRPRFQKSLPYKQQTTLLYYGVSQ